MLRQRVVELFGRREVAPEWFLHDDPAGVGHSDTRQALDDVVEQERWYRQKRKRYFGPLGEFGETRPRRFVGVVTGEVAHAGTHCFERGFVDVVELGKIVDFLVVVMVVVEGTLVVVVVGR